MDNFVLKPGKDYVGTSVFGLIFDKENKVILTQVIASEKKGKDYEGIWSMPGGTIEFRETVVDCLNREIQEELGISLFDHKFLNYNDYIVSEKHWIALNFFARTKDEFRNLEVEKHADVQSFSFEDIPENISPYTGECLELIRKDKLSL